MSKDQDYLAQRYQEERARRSPLRLNVLQPRQPRPLCPNLEVLKGIGGTVVYRRRFPSIT